MKSIRVSSAYATADGSITTTRTRLFSVYVGSGGTHGGAASVGFNFEFRDGSASADVLLIVQRYGNPGKIVIGEVEIPEDGIVFPNGMYLNVSWSPSIAPGLTFFYQ